MHESILTIAIKFSMFMYTYIQSKKIKSVLLEANMKDHRNDVIVATFTLISIIASKFGYGLIDYVVGIGISIITAILIYTAQKIITLNIPVISEYIADILEIVNSRR